MAVPDISVVIPTHNRAETCRRAVESALAQDPAPLEVLVCDDGSTDGTRAEFESDARVRYLRLEHSSGGPGPARNLGIASANGTWVAFLDDDDTWLPQKLALQMEAAEAHSVDVVATNALRTSGGSYFQNLKADYEPSRADILADNPIIISTSIVRRAMFERVGPFADEPQVGAIADYELWLRLSDAGARFLVLAAPLAVYDDGDAGRMSNGVAQMQRALIRLAVRRWLRRPLSFELFRAAGNQMVRGVRTLRALP